jgi:outer membrane lipoprotein-sorting protein
MACILAVPVARADQELSDPVEILERADAAARAIKSVRYSVTTEVQGGAKGKIPEVQARVAEVGDKTSSEKPRTWIDLKARLAEEQRAQTAGFDGKTYWVIDHQTKKIHSSPDMQVIGSLARLQPLVVMPEFMNPAPFADELGAAKRELLGSRKVGDVDCYEVHIVYTEGMEAVWCFSKKDFLPRSRSEKFKTKDGADASLTKTITQLEVNQPIEDSLFKLSAPAGYEKAEGNAP